jgi:hypothetical protein
MFAEPFANYHAYIKQSLSRSKCATHNKTGLSSLESYAQRDLTNQLNSLLTCCLSQGISKFS